MFSVNSIKALLMALLALALLLPGLAQSASLDRNLFTGPCRLFGVPVPLAMAMAQVESSLNPLCVTVSGREWRPGSMTEAVRLAERAMACGRSVDVGLMQINSWWLKKLGISPEKALDPRNNVILGLYILSQETRRFGLTWQAVGAYHSPARARAQAYAAKVRKALMNMAGRSQDL